MTERFKDVFEALRGLMVPAAESLDVTRDETGNYDVNTFHTMKNKKRLWFGGVNIKKNYVSYHLMPVYVNPSLLNAISPELKKQMQGKSCFNFKTIDSRLFNELAALTKSGLADYQKQGLLGESS